MTDKNQTENRPNPEDLLERINKESRGKLTVFLGAAAGVGKTYSMLETAHARMREGSNIVIGWIETHGRQETEMLADGLTRIPAKELEYRSRTLSEMDIDAILEQKPELVLVDELAHTNVPGSRNVRRYQDVEELLKAGINVYTTINIQHIESLNDVVAQITGVIVRETVPDYIIEQAETVKLIDIPPEDLIKRLNEGKVYVPDQARHALRKFFRQGNINALRELSLRFTALWVDKDLSEYMREQGIRGPWAAAGRVMVCVSASPFSAQLIRAARLLAGGIQADLLAVHVEPERQLPTGDKERDRLARNVRLAEELGAKTLTVVGKDLVEEILEVARSHNVTTIVIGKPRRRRWRNLILGSTVDKLIRHCGVIHVHIIQSEAEHEQAPATIRTDNGAPRTVPWQHYIGGLVMMTAVTGFSLLINIASRVELINIALLYQLPVTLSAFWWGRWPSYFTALCSVLVFDYIFLSPSIHFKVDDIRYLWSFATFLFVAFVIGGRTEYLRMEAATARVRERSTRALYHFSREIAAITDLKTIAEGIVKQAAEVINRAVAVLLPSESGRLEVWAEYDPSLQEREQITSTEPLSLNDSGEAAVASWAYQHGQVTGRSTDTLPGADYLYIPLKTPGAVVGVLSIHLGETHLTPLERRLVDAWTGLAAVALERALSARNKCPCTQLPALPLTDSANKDAW